ncbi:MAG: ABC transporter ATP-binding protein [Anaerolineae bacterium]|nr:ABC transporter ATP-binding protein [Anaerolineae bacterium]MDW8101837.1 ABC transporter ATP-binding protein [Anaerolineae bacterium]
MVVLEAVNISMTYSSRQGPVEALRGVSLEVREGEFVCIVGPSGCGKTTLLRILSGLLKPVSGHVLWKGKPLRGPRPEMGFVFQKANLMPWRNVLENVLLPLEVKGINNSKAMEKASSILKAMGLEGFFHAYPRELSGGMEQKVALARALVYDPDILFLDEPFSSLDALTREKLNVELARLWRNRCKTVVMVTHNLQEAVFLADRVMVMSPRPGTLKAQFAVPFPHPRDLSITFTPEFVALARTVREAVEH